MIILFKNKTSGSYFGIEDQIPEGFLLKLLLKYDFFREFTKKPFFLLT